MRDPESLAFAALDALTKGVRGGLQSLPRLLPSCCPGLLCCCLVLAQLNPTLPPTHPPNHHTHSPPSHRHPQPATRPPHMTPPAHPPAQVSSANLERVRKVKTRHQRLLLRAEALRDEMERFLGDDDDMAKM